MTDTLTPEIWHKTFQYRVKDSSCRSQLSRMANSVNQVWNFCNATSLETAFDDVKEIAPKGLIERITRIQERYNEKEFLYVGVKSVGVKK